MGRDPAAHFGGRKRRSVAQIGGGGAQFVKRKDRRLCQPGITQIRALPLLGAAQANPWPCGVQIHPPVCGLQQLGERGVVGVARAVKAVVVDREVAVGAPEHVFFLRHQAFHIAAAWHIRVGHVQDRKAVAIARGHGAGHFAPVAGLHFYAQRAIRRHRPRLPAGKVGGGQTLIVVRCFGLHEGGEGVAQHRAPSHAVRLVGVAQLCAAFREQGPSWHGGSSGRGCRQRRLPPANPQNRAPPAPPRPSVHAIGTGCLARP